MTSTVGVVVITKDRPERVLETVQGLCALPERPPIVVVDNGSVRSAGAALRNVGPAVTVLELPVNIGAAARNVGVAALGTRYVAFCDDDVRWDDGCLQKATELLDAHPDVAVVVAQLMDQRGGGSDPICDVLAASPLRAGSFPGPALVGFLAGVSVVRRAALMQAGGFLDRFLIGGEEELLAIDLLARGWTIVYSCELTAWHDPGERDVEARRVLTIRNRLWTIWLRYPVVPALKCTAKELRVHRRRGISAAVAACRHGRWVIRARRPMPASVLADIRAVHTSRLSGGVASDSLIVS